MNKIVISEEHDPYYNLALEEELLRNALEDETTFYIWQNEKTIVIGRNQNPYMECDIEELEKNNVKLARRISGGGAVFHDLGNVNFTFITKSNQSNLEKQLKVIKRAVENFGIEVEFSGRNDLLSHGKKFSGHAFYEEDGNYFHHGTLMVDVDLNNLERILKPSKLKLEGKGISSVKSRVINLKDINENITITKLIEELIESFRYYYVEPKETMRCSKDRYIPKLIHNYSDEKWIYGESPVYNVVIERSTPLGNIQAYVNVEQGLVKDIKIFSDSISTLDFREIEDKIRNTYFHEIQWEAYF